VEEKASMEKTKEKAEAEVTEKTRVEAQEEHGRSDTDELRDVYSWLEKAPKLRDRFLAAVKGPEAALYDEDEKREALAKYRRIDVVVAMQHGFC
jgi:hypothetical protein